MTDDNSFIYNNHNLYSVMKEAIILNNEKYKIKQKHLLKFTKKLYQKSHQNVEKALKYISNHL